MWHQGSLWWVLRIWAVQGGDWKQPLSQKMSLSNWWTPEWPQWLPLLLFLPCVLSCVSLACVLATCGEFYGLVSFSLALSLDVCVFWASYRCTRELDQALAAATPIPPSLGNADTPSPTFHPVCTFCSFYLPGPKSTASACHGCFDGQFLIPKLSVTGLSLAEIKMSFGYG